VAQGYTQSEGIDFYEIFAPVAHLESIHILFSISYHLNFQTISDGYKKRFI